MNIEKEYKFKVDKIPNNLESKYIVQTYFNKEGKLDRIKSLFKDIDINKIDTFRVRKTVVNNKTKYVLTLKSKGDFERLEYETIISKEDYNFFTLNNVISCVIKNRYYLYENNLKFEFDEYLNLKDELYTCEIEVDSNFNDMNLIFDVFNKYNIKYEDITYKNEYKNSNLIKYFG